MKMDSAVTEPMHSGACATMRNGRWHAIRGHLDHEAYKRPAATAKDPVSGTHCLISFPLYNIAAPHGQVP